MVRVVRAILMQPSSSFVLVAISRNDEFRNERLSSAKVIFKNQAETANDKALKRSANAWQYTKIRETSNRHRATHSNAAIFRNKQKPTEISRHSRATKIDEEQHRFEIC